MAKESKRNKLIPYSVVLEIMCRKYFCMQIFQRKKEEKYNLLKLT